MTPARRKSFMAQFSAAKREVSRLKRLYPEAMRWATLKFPPLPKGPDHA